MYAQSHKYIHPKAIPYILTDVDTASPARYAVWESAPSAHVTARVPRLFPNPARLSEKNMAEFESAGIDIVVLEL